MATENLYRPHSAHIRPTASQRAQDALRGVPDDILGMAERLLSGSALTASESQRWNAFQLQHR
ncbi:MAG: hypothetical protein HYX52_05595 [Chloroflexi bacterium]|nr:hypothetical protein [Chloroflexota bacterium]